MVSGLKPKEYTGGGYGQNGFYLDFSDPDDIGADRSDSTHATRSLTRRLGLS